MTNRRLLNERKNLESKQQEVVKAHYVGAVILIAAAVAFLLLVFAVSRVIDFSRFAY
ncbi:MAG TPA: hypothetical protein VEH78_00700 [Pseudolabrys sp.]|nr:hypothetical protein [Pseudolabrys sp.]